MAGSHLRRERAVRGADLTSSCSTPEEMIAHTGGGNGALMCGGVHARCAALPPPCRGMIITSRGDHSSSGISRPAPRLLLRDAVYVAAAQHNLPPRHRHHPAVGEHALQHPPRPAAHARHDAAERCRRGWRVRGEGCKRQCLAAQRPSRPPQPLDKPPQKTNTLPPHLTPPSPPHLSSASSASPPKAGITTPPLAM